MQNAECKLKNAKSKIGGCVNKPLGKPNFDFCTLHFFILQFEASPNLCAYHLVGLRRSFANH